MSDFLPVAILVTGLAVLASRTPAVADGTAALAAGDLTFANTTALRMAEEALYMSPEKVRVRFVIANDTDKDVETLVAFPLPDIDTGEFSHSGVGEIGPDPVNFVDFTLTVGGRPTPFATEQRALVKDRDVSTVLKAAGVPLNLIAVGDPQKFLQKLPNAARQALLTAGAIRNNGEDWTPLWTVKTKFSWRQKFPAHQQIVIAHSYRPVTGTFLFSATELERADQDGRNAVKAYCMTDSAQAAVRAKLAAVAGETDVLTARTTDYVLKTANNWNGPIGRFQLTLNKIRPDNVLSLCWNGRITPLSATTFAAVQTKFAPTQDVHLLVVEAPIREPTPASPTQQTPRQ